MQTTLEDAVRIAAIGKRLLAEWKKYEGIQRRWTPDVSSKQAQKFSADLNWQAMNLCKIEDELHAACVDAGIADLREARHYEQRTFKPSGWHTYAHTPAQPKALAATKAGASA